MYVESMSERKRFPNIQVLHPLRWWSQSARIAGCAQASMPGMLTNDKLVFACGTGSSAPLCQRSGRVYPKYFGKTTRQNAPPPAMTAIGENSARPIRVFVQILLWLALKRRCSSRPPLARQRPRRRRRPSNARWCSINAIICTLVISSPFALFRCLFPRVLLLPAWPVPLIV